MSFNLAGINFIFNNIINLAIPLDIGLPTPAAWLITSLFCKSIKSFGLIIFSEKVFTLLPLSTDLELIQRMIAEINTDFLGSGTNIGDALALGVGRAQQSLAENKVIVYVWVIHV